MITESGVAKIRLRGTNPALSNALPQLYVFAGHCTSFGSFLDEAVRFLAAYRLEIMSIEYHAGLREVTLMVRG